MRGTYEGNFHVKSDVWDPYQVAAEEVPACLVLVFGKMSPYSVACNPGYKVTGTHGLPCLHVARVMSLDLLKVGGPWWTILTTFVMYRHSTGGASTPSSAAGRRSARAARGSTKRRRSDGSGTGSKGRRGRGDGLKHKFEQEAQRTAKKWVKVYRAPASNVTFKVKTWVPFSDLTEEERLDYDEKRERDVAVRLRKQLGNENSHSQEDSNGEPIDQTTNPILEDDGIGDVKNDIADEISENIKVLDSVMDDDEANFLGLMRGFGNDTDSSAELPCLDHDNT